MEDENLTNAPSEFGELFEGETAAFETTFAESDVLSRVENGTGISTSRENASNSNQQSSSSLKTMQKQRFKKIDVQNPTNSESSNKVEGNIAVNNVAVRRQQSCEDGDSLLGVNGEDRVMIVKDEVKEKVSLSKDLNLVVRHKINKHLKQRGYLESLLPKVVTKEILSKMIDPSLFKTNSILFGSTTYRADEIHDEIGRFYKFFLWVKERNTPMSIELKPMLMPILVFLVRESYSNGFKPMSNRLIGDFSRKILQVSDKTHENCLIAIAMSMIKSAQGFEDKYLAEVCQRRHKFILSESTFGTLKKFLSKLKKGILAHILANHFIIELRSSQEINETSAADPPEKRTSSMKSRRISRVLERLRGSVTANLPSIKMFTTNGLPASAAVSCEGSTFAFGMSTSGIRICEKLSAKKAPLAEDDNNEDTIYTPSIKTISGHEGAVYGVCFHPRTKLLWSVGQDSVMRTWDLTHETTIGCKAVYRGHCGPIWSIDMSPSGQLIGTTSLDSTARIWVPERVECVRILAGHYSDVNSIKFHPNESYVATGSLDKSARLWSVSDGDMVRIMTGSNGSINTLAFHKSGNYLVGGGIDDMVRIWDIREGELIAELPSTKNCKDLSFCGNMLAGCFRDGCVQIWNLRNIVGGSDNAHLKEDFIYTVPKPYTVQGPASSLIRLFYKDTGSLYCLGSHPIQASDPEDKDRSLDTLDPTEETISTNSVPHSTIISDNCDSAQVVITFNSVQSYDTFDMISNSGSPIELATTTLSISADDSVRIISRTHAPIAVSSEDIQNCLEDVDAENTNNTITSSDMEFEVDDQILESFVDDNSLLQS